MESTNTKWFAAGIGMLIITLLFSFTQSLKTADSTSLDEILKIAMPRPVKEFILAFSLEGRNIIREIEEGVTGKPALAKKPKGSATKAAVDKGQKAKISAAKAAARRRAQLNERRRKAFQARVIEQAERYRQSLRAQAISQEYDAYVDEYNTWNKTKAQNVNGQEKENKEPQKKTSAEWKSLILTQPNQANLEVMIKALPAGEIELDTYLEISEALIKDNSQDKRRMGVWALTSVYRQEAFVMAAHIIPETDTATQKLLNDYIYSYNRAQTLGVFDQVLKSQDAVAATAAAESITKAIQQLKAGSADNKNSNERNNGSRTGGRVQQLTLNSYQRLIPTLKFVANKNLNNLSQWAQNMLSQLQTMTTTA